MPSTAPSHRPHPQLDFQAGQGDYRVYIVNLDLAQGSAYFMRIYATNRAGLEGYRCGGGAWGAHGGAAALCCVAVAGR